MSNAEEFRKWAANRKPPTCFHFGVHKDVPFSEVPTKYLEWFINEGHGTRELYDAVSVIYWGRMNGSIPRPPCDYDERGREY